MPDRARIGDRLEHAIEERTRVEQAIARGDAEARERPPRRLRRTAFWLAVTGVSLYLVAPSVLEVLGSWEDVEKLAPGWLVATVVGQAGAMASLWVLQRLAIGAE